MTQPAIRVENLGKEYQLGLRKQGYRTFRETIMELAGAPLRRFRHLSGSSREVERIWAIKDVSFEVKPGEVVGVIGRNGAGKSTLLKILTRITEPTTGRAEIRGHVGSLLEVGTGMHPELTGRENIFLNGAVLGMPRATVKRRFDEIVDFSGIEKFLDTPVKRFSSGMRVRLAFAVAAHLEPEILLIDEVLAVGDAEFQKKCLGKMGEVARGGRTVLFVSHNMAAIQHLCCRVAILRAGQLVDVGPTEMMISTYLAECDKANQLRLSERADREGTGEIRFTDICVTSGRRNDVDVVQCGSSVQIKLAFSASRRIRGPVFYLGIYDMFGTMQLHMNTRATGCHVDGVDSLGCIVCSIPELPLPPGQYRLNIAVSESENMLDRVVGAKDIFVEGGDFFGTGDMSSASYGKFLVHHSWEYRDHYDIHSVW